MDCACIITSWRVNDLMKMITKASLHAGLWFVTLDES